MIRWIGAFPIVYLIFVSMSIFVSWASFFEINETVRARGRMVAEARSQVIQPPDGGVLRSIEVREGDFVRAGQTVAVMESSSAQAGVDEVTSEIETSIIARIRATSQLAGTEPDFSIYMERYPDVVRSQIALLEGNRLAYASELEKVSQQVSIVGDQLSRVQALHGRGDVSFGELAQAQRELIEIEGVLEQVRENYRLEAMREIAEIEQRIATLSFRLAARQTALEYTTLRAPLDGVVNHISVNTLGGVLRSGDELMHIAPTGGKSLVEAHIAPVDVGRLSVGQAVSIQLDSFSTTVYGSLVGRLVYLSADTISQQSSDDHTRPQTFYVAHVAIDDSQSNNRINVNQLRPGMEATVDVQTGSRTLMVFLAKPILRAFDGALSEG